MPKPRNAIISLNDTPFYHCMSRCVRRAFLCGKDHYTGIDYEHRRDWLEIKLHQTAAAFAIKLCTYAVMHNHYHVVLNVRTDIADAWSNLDVVQHWHTLFTGTAISQKFELGAQLEIHEVEQLNHLVTLWRKRLTDVSWFMRVVNESIARQANAEDKCTGRFWEGRFKSQALLDDTALLSCMAYVDLNPIRANVASTPENSDFTGIQHRIKTLRNEHEISESIEQFSGTNAEEIGLPFLLADYLELVDYTGRILRNDKLGSMEPSLPPILERLGLNRKKWNILTTSFESQFSHWVGREGEVRKLYKNKQYQRIPSTESYRALLG